MRALASVLIASQLLCGCANLPLPSLGIGVQLQLDAAARSRTQQLRLTLDWRPRALPTDGSPPGDPPAAPWSAGGSGAATTPVDAALGAWELRARSRALRSLSLDQGAPR